MNKFSRDVSFLQFNAMMKLIVIGLLLQTNVDGSKNQINVSKTLMYIAVTTKC